MRNHHPNRVCNKPVPDGAWCAVATLNVQGANFRWLRNENRDDGNFVVASEAERQSKVRELMGMLERRKIRVAMLTEVSSTGLGPGKYKKRWGPYRIFGSARVALVIHKVLLLAADGKTELQPKHLTFGPRLSAIWLRGMWFASAWQPESAATPAKKLELSNYLVAREKLITKVGNARVVVGGDHNAHIGEFEGIKEVRENACVGLAPLLGRCSEAGRAVLEWADANSLWVPDTHRHIRQRGTFRVNRGAREWKELDYFLASTKVQVARMRSVHPGINTDHKMKMMWIRLGLTTAQQRHLSWKRAQRVQTTGVKLPVAGLRDRDPATQQAYMKETDIRVTQSHIAAGGVGRIENEEELEARWDFFEEAISAGARTAVPEQAERRMKALPPWVDVAEVKKFQKAKRKLLADRMLAGSAAERTRHNRELRHLSDEHKRKDRADFRLYMERLVQETGQEYRQCPRKDYQRLKESGVIYTYVQSPEVREESGFQIDEVKDHFSKLMMRPGDLPEGFKEVMERNVEERPVSTSDLWGVPSEEEIAKTVQKSADCATGVDGIHKVHVMGLGDIGWGEWCELVQGCFRCRKVPVKTQIIKMVALYKGKNLPKDKLTNYRAIALITLLSKTCESILKARVLHHLESIGYWREEAAQRGFREDCSTADVILLLTFVMDMARTMKKPAIMDELCLLMVDFKKAFPSVVRRCVYMILERVGVPEPDLDLLKHLHESCEFFITLDGEESERWMSTRGFKEGGASSPTLFNVLSEVMFRELARRLPGLELLEQDEILTKLRSIQPGDIDFDLGIIVRRIIAVLFADDSTLFTRMSGAKKAEDEVKTVAKLVGQEIHPDKTERVLVRGRWEREGIYGPPTRDGILEMAGFQPQAKIVGCDISGVHSAEVSFRRHFKKADVAWRIWRPILKRQRGLPRHVKGSLIKSNILSHVYYCTGVRYWTQPLFNEVDTFVNKMLRCLTATSFRSMRGKQNNFDLRHSFGLHSARLTVELLTLSYIGHKFRQGRDATTGPGKKEWYDARFPAGRIDKMIMQSLLVWDAEGGVVNMAGQRRSLARQWREIMERAGVEPEMSKTEWAKRTNDYVAAEEYAEWTASYAGGAKQNTLAVSGRNAGTSAMRAYKNANEFGDAATRGIVSSHTCPTCDVRYEHNDKSYRSHVTRCAKTDMADIDLSQIICIRVQQQGRKSGQDWFNTWYCRSCAWQGQNGIGPKQMRLVQKHAGVCSSGQVMEEKGRQAVRIGVHQHIIERNAHDNQNGP